MSCILLTFLLYHKAFVLSRGFLKFFKFLLPLSFGADGAYLLPTSHLPLTLSLYHKAFVLSRTILIFLSLSIRNQSTFITDFCAPWSCFILNLIRGNLLCPRDKFFCFDFFDFPYLVYKLYQNFFKMSRSFFCGGCTLFKCTAFFPSFYAVLNNEQKLQFRLAHPLNQYAIHRNPQCLKYICKEFQRLI